jgi:hypothetical protein
MRRTRFTVVAALLVLGAAVTLRGLVLTSQAVPSVRITPVAHWSLEAQRAIVPPPAGVGNKFPGEAAVYMAIVHVAMYDAVMAIQGGYRPYAVSLAAPADTSPEAAIAAATHRVLVALLPAQQGDLDNRYSEYLSKLRGRSTRGMWYLRGWVSTCGWIAVDVRCCAPTTGGSIRAC